MPTQEKKEQVAQKQIHFDFRSHHISPELITELANKKISVLSGELSNNVLLSNLGANPNLLEDKEFIEYILDFSYGGSKEDRADNILLFRELLKSGLTFWTTDSLPRFVHEQNLDYPANFYFALYMLIIGSSTLLAALNTKHGIRNIFNSGLTRREFLRAALNVGAYTFISYTLKDLLIGKSFHVSVISKIQEIINNPEFIPNIDALITMRNDLMALNSHHMLALHKDQVLDTNVLLYAGSYHKGAKKSFELGPEALIERFEVYADILLNDTLDVLLADKTIDDKNLLEVLKGYSTLFTQPNQYNQVHRTFSLPNFGEYLPFCANAVLTTRIISALNSTSVLEKKHSVLQSFLALLIQENHNWDLLIKSEIINFLGKLPPGTKQPETYSTMAQTINRTQFTSLYIFPDTSTSQRMFLNTELIGVGVLFGRTVPVVSLPYNGVQTTFVMIDNNRFLQMV